MIVNAVRGRDKNRGNEKEDIIIEEQSQPGEALQKEWRKI